MAVTPASFRQNYPEFGSVAAYPASAINYWLGYAEKLILEIVWSTCRDLGIELFIAHNLAIEAQAQQEAANGSPPGGTVGPANNVSVDKVSIGYDVGSGIEPEAGHWNLTVYGTRFIRMVKMFGAGPIQVGVPLCGPGPLSSANAWSGPWPWNFPSMNE